MRARALVSESVRVCVCVHACVRACVFVCVCARFDRRRSLSFRRRYGPSAAAADSTQPTRRRGRRPLMAPGRRAAPRHRRTAPGCRHMALGRHIAMYRCTALPRRFPARAKLRVVAAWVTRRCRRRLSLQRPRGAASTRRRRPRRRCRASTLEGVGGRKRSRVVWVCLFGEEVLQRPTRQCGGTPFLCEYSSTPRLPPASSARLPR